MERLLERLCNAPERVQGLFETDIPQLEAVELLFYEYQYCTPEEKTDTGCWWTRRLVNRSDAIDCQVFETLNGFN